MVCWPAWSQLLQLVPSSVDGARREFAAELLALDIEAELARSGVELNALLGPGPAPAEAPEHSLPGDEPKR
jgi:hypothetical protein